MTDEATRQRVATDPIDVLDQFDKLCGASSVLPDLSDLDSPVGDLTNDDLFQSAAFNTGPKLSQALRAVLEMHDEFAGDDACSACGPDERGVPVPFPCPTRQTITDILGGE